MASIAQLLVVSPDNPVLQAAQHCLISLGHAPVIARSLAQAQRTLSRVHIDLLFLDSILPTEEMEQFWRWLSAKQNKATLPVILLAPPSAQLVPAGLPSFFQPERDGLVPKPLNSKELASEVARILAAAPDLQEPPDLLRVGQVTLGDRQLFLDDGSTLPLTPTESRLLRYLMQRPGTFVSPVELLEHVWGYRPGTAGPEVVRSHVSNLRRKLRTLEEVPDFLRSIPYQGYGFIPSDLPSSTA